MANKTGNVGMADLGRGAAARRVEKLNQVLLWVYRWGWSQEHIIQKLLGLKRRPCADLVKQGVLRRIEPEPGFKAVYVLGAAYIDRAQDLHESETQGQIALEYTQHRTAIPWFGLVTHNAMAQLAALSVLNEHGGLLTTGDELRVIAKAGDAIPDFVIGDGEKLTWYELERTKKYHERLALQLAERYEALQRKRFDRMVWVCGSDGVVKHVANALEQERIVNVLRGRDGRLRRDRSDEGWNPKQLLEVTDFWLFHDLVE